MIHISWLIMAWDTIVTTLWPFLLPGLLRLLLFFFFFWNNKRNFYFWSAIRWSDQAVLCSNRKPNQFGMEKRLECRAFEQLNLHDKRRRLLFSWSVLSCRRYTLRRENSLRRWCGDSNRNRRISEVRFPSLWSFLSVFHVFHWNLRGYRDGEESVFFWRGRIWFDFQNQFWQKKSEKKIKSNIRIYSVLHLKKLNSNLLLQISVYLFFLLLFGAFFLSSEGTVRFHISYAAWQCRVNRRK